MARVHPVYGALQPGVEVAVSSTEATSLLSTTGDNDNRQAVLIQNVGEAVVSLLASSSHTSTQGFRLEAGSTSAPGGHIIFTNPVVSNQLWGIAASTDTTVLVQVIR